MNKWTIRIKYFLLYLVECAENKMIQKWAMEIHGGVGLESLKVEKQTTGWSKFYLRYL